MIANQIILTDHNILPSRTSPLYCLELQISRSKSLKRSNTSSLVAGKRAISSSLARSLSVPTTRPPQGPPTKRLAPGPPAKRLTPDPPSSSLPPRPPTRLKKLQALNLSTGELNMDDADRNSLYSFDSVSTNCRLLDRLGLDNESVYADDDEVFDPSKRNLVASVQTTGRLLDRLGLDDGPYTTRDSQLPQIPRQPSQPAPRNNSFSNQRYPAAQMLGSNQQKIFLSNVINKNKHNANGSANPMNNIRIQNINKPISLINSPRAGDTLFQRRNNSIRSVHADLAFDSSSESGSSSNHSVADLPELDRLNSNHSESTIHEDSYKSPPITPKQSKFKDSDKHHIGSVPFATSATEYTPDDTASEYAAVVEDDDEDSPSDTEVYAKPVNNPKTRHYYQNLDEFDFNSSNDSINETPSRRPKYSASSNTTPSKATPPDFNPPGSIKNPPMRSASDSLVQNEFRNHQRNTSNSSIPGFVTNSPTSRRIASDSSNPKVIDSPTSSLKSNNSFSAASSPNPQNSDLTPESRTKLATQLRSMGNHREASYQLQICANIPYNYPKAMFLYAMALKFGQGVKKNDRQSLKWLAKTILVSNMMESNPNAASSPSSYLNNYINKINELQPEELIFLVNKATNDNYDPNKFFDYYSSLPEAQQSKILHNKHANIALNAYHELGNALVHAWGLNKPDEAIGIAFLSKAGSSGHVDSMVQLGEIWCSKSKHHKKDHYQAAAWLRLSELFGAKSIGNSWIYKDKYMPKKAKK